MGGGEGGMDQYAGQFLMRGRIGPSQADGNPALTGVVVPHCLSAGDQVFVVSRDDGAPSGGPLLLHTTEFLQIFTFVVFSVFSNTPLTQRQRHIFLNYCKKV